MLDNVFLSITKPKYVSKSGFHFKMLNFVKRLSCDITTIRNIHFIKLVVINVLFMKHTYVIVEHICALGKIRNGKKITFF